MSDEKLDSDPRRGWFKLLIPDIQEVFSGLFWSEKLNVNPVDFLYGRLDPAQVSFDCALSVPFLAVDRVVLVQADERDETQQPSPDGEVGFQLQMLPLKLLATEQENRCYIPAEVVTCIIPVDVRHPIVDVLVQVTSESGLIIPSLSGVTPSGPGQIVDMLGHVVDVVDTPSEEKKENGKS